MNDKKSLKCKECKYFFGGENISLCQYKSSWEITEPDNKCCYLPEYKELTCGDCWRLESDMEYYGGRPEDSAYINGKLCYDWDMKSRNRQRSYITEQRKIPRINRNARADQERAAICTSVREHR